MDRRGFLGSLLGIAVGAALPKQALSLLEKTASLPDAAFISQAGVELNFTSAELNMALDDFTRKYLEPAMAALAKRIDDDVMNAIGGNA